MNPKATETTKIPMPKPIAVFLTITWLSSVIISHLGRCVFGYAVSPLYASISSCCHVCLLLREHMRLELLIDLSHQLNWFYVIWSKSSEDKWMLIVESIRGNEVVISGRVLSKWRILNSLKSSLLGSLQLIVANSMYDREASEGFWLLHLRCGVK